MDMYEFESSGMLGDFPESVRLYMGLESLDAIVNGSDYNGATRLFVCPSLEPIEVLTLVFRDDQVQVSHAASDENLWERVACGDDPSGGATVSSVDRAFHPNDLPATLQDWKSVSDAVIKADSCMSDNPAGISYYHSAYGLGVDSARAWFNPTESANLNQCTLLDAYTRVRSLL